MSDTLNTSRNGRSSERSGVHGATAMQSKDLLKSTSDQKLIGTLEGWLETCKKSRITFERKWYENLAFYFGKQYIQWTSSLSTVTTSTGIMRLYEPPAPPWRVRLVSNKIRPIIRRELAKLTKEKPQPFVIPATTDDDDLAAARAAEAIYEHVTRTLNFDRTVRRCLFWTCLTGTSFIKDWYDPDAVDDDGVQGCIRIEEVNPFHIYAPILQEEELENQPYIIQVLAKSVGWIADKFKVNLPPDAEHGASVLEQRFLSAMGITEPSKDMVTVKEVWVKPCGQFPKGAHVIWAGTTILSQSEGWPWGYSDYPYTKFDHIPSGQFYGESVIPDLIPVQKEFNRTRSQIIEAKNRMAKPQLAAPRGSIDPSKVTSEPGLIVFYTPGFQAPTPIPLVPIPGYVIQELERCQQDMDDISGQHEINKGKAPPDVSAATAISFLQEQDDTMLSISITALEEGIGRVGRHILTHVKEFWEADRTVKVIGENNAFEVFMFNKASINGNTDLNIQAGSAMPRSSAAKQAFITELMDKKYITPEQGLRYLNMAETQRMYEELQVSARQAQRENLRMAQGEEVWTNTYDEDAIHVQEHDLHRRRQAFENYPDEIKELFETHVNQHKQRIAQAQGTPIRPGDQLPSPGGGEGEGAGGAPPSAGPPPLGPPPGTQPPLPVGLGGQPPPGAPGPQSPPQ